MRKTSFGLGLAGSILAFVIGISMLVVAIGFSVVSHVDWESNAYDFDDVDISIDAEDYSLEFDNDNFSFDLDNGFRTDFSGIPNTFARVLGGWLLFASIALLISGVLGIIGSIISKKRRSVGAGIMLLIAGVLSIFSLYGLHAAALLIPSGVLAFFKDKNEKEKIEA